MISPLYPHEFAMGTCYQVWSLQEESGRRWLVDDDWEKPPAEAGFKGFKRQIKYRFLHRFLHRFGIFYLPGLKKYPIYFLVFHAYFCVFCFCCLLCPVYMVGYWQGCRLVIIAFGLILMFMSAASRPVSKNVQKWIDIFQLFYYVFENQDWTCSIFYLLQDDYICKWTMEEPLIVNINH